MWRIVTPGDGLGAIPVLFTRERVTPTPQDACRCGHALAAHDHFRRGRDCGACGAAACPRFQLDPATDGATVHVVAHRPGTPFPRRRRAAG